MVSLVAASGCAMIAGVRDDLELVAPTEGGADAGSDGEAATACRESETVCSGRCVNLQTDPAHCGRCNEPCGDAALCSAGGCTTGGCTLGLEECDGSCVDLKADPDHCGFCQKKCRNNEDCIAATCVAGPLRDR